jgi:hypothetical protein
MRVPDDLAPKLRRMNKWLPTVLATRGENAQPGLRASPQNDSVRCGSPTPPRPGQTFAEQALDARHSTFTAWLFCRFIGFPPHDDCAKCSEHGIKVTIWVHDNRFPPLDRRYIHPDSLPKSNELVS